MHMDKKDTNRNNGIKDTFTKAILYARVSTSDQSCDRQVKDLTDYCTINHYSIKEVLYETITGISKWRDRATAPAIRNIQAGEILLATEPSRLARKVGDLLDLCDYCLNRRASVGFLAPPINFNGDIFGRAVVSIIGVIGELERNINNDRSISGINLVREKLKQDGKYVSRAGNIITRLGRPLQDKYRRKLDGKETVIVSMFEKGISITDASKILNVSRKTLYSFISSRGIKV